jgi:hypothetical protein
MILNHCKLKARYSVQLESVAVYKLHMHAVQEDDITKYESRDLEQTISKAKNNEHQRNSNRVCELYSYINLQNKVIGAAMEGNFDV